MEVAIKAKSSGRRSSLSQVTKLRRTDSVRKIARPKIFQHYVMNLPATAISFLDAFIGLYKGQERLFTPHTDAQRPMVHVHCFAAKNKDAEPEAEICRRISNVLDHEVRLDGEDVHIEEVRNVAPSKQMYCASFRLPGEVLFR